MSQPLTDISGPSHRSQRALQSQPSADPQAGRELAELTAAAKGLQISLDSITVGSLERLPLQKTLPAGNISTSAGAAAVAPRADAARAASAAVHRRMEPHACAAVA